MSWLQIFIIQNLFRGRSSNIGRGGRNVLLPNRKNSSRKRVLSCRCINTFGEEVEIPKVFNKDFEKSQFSIEILSKLSKFFERFPKISSFLVQTRKTLHAAFLIFHAWVEIGIKVCISCFLNPRTPCGGTWLPLSGRCVLTKKS